MKGSVRTVSATEFKAKCLGLLDRVSQSREAFVVTKRGKPVAKVVPVDDAEPGPLRGSVVFLGDIVEPIDDEWEAE